MAGTTGGIARKGRCSFTINGVEPGFASRQPDSTVVIPPNLIDPIAQYDTHHEGHSVIGGFVYHGRRFPQLRDRYVFGEYSRLFGFPEGPDDHGRLLYFKPLKKSREPKLRKIHEFRGFAHALAALGLTAPPHGPEAFPQTMSVLGMAQDASGEVYVPATRPGARSAPAVSSCG